MITVRKEFIYPVAKQPQAKAVTKEYKELFDPSLHAASM